MLHTTNTIQNHNMFYRVRRNTFQKPDKQNKQDKQDNYRYRLCDWPNMQQIKTLFGVYWTLKAPLSAVTHFNLHHLSLKSFQNIYVLLEASWCMYWHLLCFRGHQTAAVKFEQRMIHLWRVVMIFSLICSHKYL